MTKIAHISDLHFSSRTNTNDPIWVALRDDLANQNADILAVTGDLVDNPLSDVASAWRSGAALDKARKYLFEVCHHAGIDKETSLLVIPGNHDVRTRGYWRFDWDLFKSFFDRFRPYTNHRYFDSHKLCIFSFNSNADNPAINFATGIVDESELLEFARAATEFADKHPAEWQSCVRMAIVHHHPMPIAETEHNKAKIDIGWYLTFRNAGLFMREMANSGIGVILHGHKHFPAHSRVGFLVDGEYQLTTSIVAAGSVGLSESHPLTYNVLTVFDNGEMDLERRDRTLASYTRAKTVSLVAYPEARLVKRRRLAAKVGSLLRTKKIVVTWVIADESGDCDHFCEFQKARSLSGKPVPEIPQQFKAEVAKLGLPKFECAEFGRSISWEKREIKDAGTATDPKNHTIDGAIVFNPPIGDESLTFTRKFRLLNAISFNQRDTLGISGGKDRDQGLATKSPHFSESLVVQIHFPKNRMPKAEAIRVDVRDEESKPEPKETEFVANKLTTSVLGSSVIFSLETPLPGYTYIIKWDVPVNEAEEYGMTAAENFFSGELTRKIIGLRESKGSADGKGQTLLKNFRDSLAGPGPFLGIEGEAEMDIHLFAFDDAKDGLVCAASLRDRPAESRLWSWVIERGSTFIDSAYSRRQSVLWIHDPKKPKDEDAIYKTFLNDAGQPEEKHKVIFAIPLFYPVRNGKPVAVVSFASRAYNSVLLGLESKAALLALLDQTIAWYSTTLASSLGMKPFPPGK